MSKLRLIGRDPNSFSRARPSSRIPDPASSTMSSPSARTSAQVVLPPYRTVVAPGTGIEPRTPHSFSRVDDSDAADIGNQHRVCHATAPKPRVFAAPSQPLGGAKKSCPEISFGQPKGNSNCCLKRADDEPISKEQLLRTRR